MKCVAIVVLVAVFVALCSAADHSKRDIRCCLPKQFTTFLSIFQELSGGSANIQEWNDEIGQRVRIDLSGNFSVHELFYNIWEDYEYNEKCILDMINNQCYCQGFYDDFPYECIDDQFDYATSVYIGEDLCEVWSFSDKDNETIADVTFTAEDCIPMITNLDDHNNGFFVAIYYNFTDYIQDFSVFSSCTPSPTKELMNADQIFAFELWDTVKSIFAK